MSCKCPQCGKVTSNVGTLFSHLINIHDPAHDEWLKSYCKSNNIDLLTILLNRAKEIPNANKPLTTILKRDFCNDC
jgi:hypothetical protein